MIFQSTDLQHGLSVLKMDVHINVLGVHSLSFSTETKMNNQNTGNEYAFPKLQSFSEDVLREVNDL